MPTLTLAGSQSRGRSSRRGLDPARLRRNQAPRTRATPSLIRGARCRGCWRHSSRCCSCPGRLHRTEAQPAGRLGHRPLRDRGHGRSLDLFRRRSTRLPAHAALKAVRGRGVRLPGIGHCQCALGRRSHPQRRRAQLGREALRPARLVPGPVVVHADRVALRGLAWLLDLPDRLGHFHGHGHARRAPHGLQHLLQLERQGPRSDRPRRSVSDGHPSGIRHRRPCNGRRADNPRARGNDDARTGDAVRANTNVRRKIAQIVVAKWARIRADARCSGGHRPQDSVVGPGRGGALRRLLSPAPSA